MSLIHLLFICLAVISLTYSTDPSEQRDLADTHSNEGVPANVRAVQEILNGFADQTHQSAPDVTGCLDEGTAIEIIYYLNEILNTAANKELLTVPSKLNNLNKQTETQLAQCWKDNKNFQFVSTKADTKDVSLKNIYFKFAEYSLTGNYDALVDSASEMKADFNGGHYEAVGNSLGELVDTVLNYKSDLGIDISDSFNKVYSVLLKNAQKKMEGSQLFSFGWGNNGNYGSNFGDNFGWNGDSSDQAYNDYTNNNDYDNYSDYRDYTDYDYNAGNHFPNS